MATVLIVDDQEKQRNILADILAVKKHRVFQASGVDNAMDQIKEFHPEVVLTDLKMPGKGGLNLIEKISRLTPSPEVIVMTAFSSIETAIKAIRLGAYDYLAKPLETEEVLFLIEKAYEKYTLKVGNQHLKKELIREVTSNMVAESLAMRDILKMVEKVSASDATVLVLGETGTGKESLARLIHLQSQRWQNPMQSVNCAAFPETLLESELFGYEKGAFTGAAKRKIGIIETASGSTLFLDEVADMSPTVQAKVLRFLQEREIRRVGGKENIKVDIRIIAATNKDLKDAIKTGRFREDLFYRLNVVPITIPPLRERKEDIPVLINHFHSKFCLTKTIESSAMNLIMKYDWPGNIRELEAMVERCTVLSNKDKVSIQDLPPELTGKRFLSSTSLLEIPDEGIVFEEWERKLLVGALEKANGNMVIAAKLLGMSYRTFRYRVNRFDISTM
ncbi:MAG: sigma-54 dependent transcriptional regulator [Chitinispirillia bacterium]